RNCNTVSVGIERVTEQDVYHVVNRVSRSLGIGVHDYVCLSEALSAYKGRYWLLLLTPGKEHNSRFAHKAERLADEMFNSINIEVSNSRENDRFLLAPRVLVGKEAEGIVSEVRAKARFREAQEKEKSLFSVSESEEFIMTLRVSANTLSCHA
ncbi:MAG TPA: hypothetical protein VM492_16760, partial [Sumerlaeia bacterium]|nr:hypothetical protein [Sumerlaeia bacterium]